ncbi:hypothetical protein B0J18DRAFT_262033 [Chaetomium sp. MPI-SDFR-AT-0129]|nr:hypothetical protein B0J18DRAFT_262033 [Chaetomium sp. MPI-SDFR-AT-0129]
MIYFILHQIICIIHRSSYLDYPCISSRTYARYFGRRVGSYKELKKKFWIRARSAYVLFASRGDGALVVGGGGRAEIRTNPVVPGRIFCPLWSFRPAARQLMPTLAIFTFQTGWKTKLGWILSPSFITLLLFCVSSSFFLLLMESFELHRMQHTSNPRDSLIDNFLQASKLSFPFKHDKEYTIEI